MVNGICERKQREGNEEYGEYVDGQGTNRKIDEV